MRSIEATGSVEQFAKEIAGRIKGYLPDAYQDVETEIVEKPQNNGVYRTGIRFGSPGDMDSMVIYMESYFAGHEKEGMTLDEIMEDIAAKVTECAGLGEKVFDREGKDFEKVRDLLEPVLVNTRANRERLKDMPHMPVEDLSAICQVTVPLGEGCGSTPVTNSRLEEWGIGKDKLFEQAFANLQKPGACTLQSVDAKSIEIIEGTPQDNLLELPEMPEVYRKVFEGGDVRADKEGKRVR